MTAGTNHRAALDPAMAGELARQLMSVSLWTARHHDPLFERLGLSAPTARALLQLPLDTAVPTRYLAGRLKCDPSNVTGVVDRLEKAGLVKRGSEHEDRRIRTLALTPAGREMRQSMYAAIASDMPALANFTDDELNCLLDLLNKAWTACVEHDAAELGQASRAGLI